MRKIITENALDRAIAAVFPKWGVQRRHARAALAATGGYVSGRRDRRETRNWRPWASSADADTIDDLPSLRGRARDLTRNTPLVTGALRTVTISTIGAGLRLKPTIDAEFLGLSEDAADAWHQAAVREFALFSRRADFTGVNVFEELQSLSLRTVLESGDAFLTRRFRSDAGDVYALKLQLLEADRVSSPGGASLSRANGRDIVDGVELDRNGVPLAYHITNRHPGDYRRGGSTEWTRVVKRDRNGDDVVVHLFDRQRPEQTRGVPWTAPIIETVKQLGNYTEAEAAAAVVSAMLTVFITRPYAMDDTGEPIIGSTADVADPAKEIELGRAAVLDLEEGEKPEVVNPGRPNPSFDPFVQALARQIGAGLGIPFEVLFMHFSASYSASRAALEMAWQFYATWRLWMARRVCCPVYEWFLAEAVARGRIEAPGFFDDPAIRAAWCGAMWIGPNQIQIDPKKEAEADEIDLRNGFKTRDEVIIERTGGTFEAKHRQLAKERRMRVADGLEGTPVAPSGNDASDDDEPDEPADEGESE